MDIKILIAMHKPYWRPKDKAYHSLYVGARGREADWAQLRDDVGDNISAKNPNFCELTGLYWAWKNLDCEYIGLCHYRRYFIRRILGMSLHIFNHKDYAKAMEKCDIMVPKFTRCEPSVFERYAQAHHAEDMIKTGEIIAELYPEYKKTFDEVMAGSETYYLNMFCTRKDIFNNYCEWLFNILFTLEQRIDISDYDDYQKRVFGFISERLFMVFIKHNNLKVGLQDVYYLDKGGWHRKAQLWLQKKIY
ncbi:DUF4422 domain-containing protein [Selenomonas ruminantium]|nr:DUF4422 domain-containing protein [Selenomonas ruminantium]